MFRTFGFGLFLASAMAANVSAHPLTTSQTWLSTPDADGRWVMRTIPPNKLPTKSWEHAKASSEATGEIDAIRSASGASHWVKN